MTEATVYQADFPFEEIRDPNGDYFHTLEEARALGYADSQIWSVTQHDYTFCYGPCHHYVNMLGYVVTLEHHDGNTYYEESVFDENLEP